MRPEWRLRCAAPTDAAALSLIANATFLETYAGIVPVGDMLAYCAVKNAPELFLRWAGASGHALLIAEHDETQAPLGFAALTPPDLPIDIRTGDIELRRIYTLASLHGGGLGAALMAAAIEIARTLGADRLLLGVHGGNARAHRFYEKHGFTLAGTRRFQVGAAWFDDRVYARDV